MTHYSAVPPGTLTSGMTMAPTYPVTLTLISVDPTKHEITPWMKHSMGHSGCIISLSVTNGAMGRPSGAAVPGLTVTIVLFVF